MIARQGVRAAAILAVVLTAAAPAQALGSPNDQPGLPRTAACLLGAWRNDIAGGGHSVWTINADGTASENGLAGGYGVASVSGNTLVIRWRSGSGYAGRYQITFNVACTYGRGEVVQETAPPGITPSASPSVWTR